MSKIIDFIERHKYGILITIAVHIAIFIYFQVETYKEAVIFHPWEFNTAHEEKDNIEITPDQIQTPEEQQLLQPNEKVSSFVRNENDKRNRTNKHNINYTSSQSSSNPEQLEDDYEQSLKDEIRRRREEKNGKKSPTTEQSSEQQNKQNSKSSEDKSNKQTSGEAIAGKTMVSYSLHDRHPLNHNDWYVRNPGYTCGNVNGVVRVKITVDVGGNVTDAEVDESKSQNATACMLEKAKEYAMKSRFNYAGEAPRKQEGTITYRFVFR
ncbi:energy transducer TonB [Brumimicrobium aurantiacum]|uniref:Energy transducer TonB n=1 Tax=Brumimicrobium aurantiacum TaxID=1737063 RepID=A0A3E1EWN2_9FLAO|nr:hypothetical protein [Brumimicrobium aurantiacum]RFC53957.1 hypothetical protein DXU93_10445 [Brumimicrobium aurantiacum]